MKFVFVIIINYFLSLVLLHVEWTEMIYKSDTFLKGVTILYYRKTSNVNMSEILKHNITNTHSDIYDSPSIHPTPSNTEFEEGNKNNTIRRFQPFRLIPVSEIQYNTISNWSFPIFDDAYKMIKILNKSETIPIKYNIDASFTKPKYFVIPNIKGLCNRLQLFAGLYILSSYYRIPIILSSSMGWSKYWNLRENFPGQLIELPDRSI